MIRFDQKNPVLFWRISYNIRENTLLQICKTNFCQLLNLMYKPVLLIGISAIQKNCTITKSRQKLFDNLLLNGVVFTIFKLNFFSIWGSNRELWQISLCGDSVLVCRMHVSQKERAMRLFNPDVFAQQKTYLFLPSLHRRKHIFQEGFSFIQLAAKDVSMRFQ